LARCVSAAVIVAKDELDSLRSQVASLTASLEAERAGRKAAVELAEARAKAAAKDEIAKAHDQGFDKCKSIYEPMVSRFISAGK